MGSSAKRSGAIRYASWPLLLILVGLAACDDTKEPAAKQAPPPGVTVVEATSASVPVVREFVGNTAAVRFVEVRAKVEGYLEERPFTEGADVKKGDVLFVIDQRPYQADLEQAKADLDQDKAALKFAQQQVARYKSLSAQNAASVQQYEAAQSRELEAAGAVKSAQAAVKNAQLNLDYTTIVAPIDGRIGNTLVNVGNLVSEEDTLLTTLVQLNPIYAYFSPSEAAYHEIQAYQAKGPIQVDMILAGDRVYAQSGKIDFVDNQVDVTTGTIKMRAVFANPDETQRPGQYVQVRLTLGQSGDSVLVPAPAIGEDESGHFVFVVGQDNKAERRNITLGPAYKDKYVVAKGVRAGEQVVTKGLQKIHGGEAVTVEKAKAQGAAEGTTAQIGAKGADDKGAGEKGSGEKASGDSGSGDGGSGGSGQ